MGNSLGQAYALNGVILYRTPPENQNTNSDTPADKTSGKTQTKQNTDANASDGTGIIGLPVNGVPGFTKDGLSAIPVTVNNGPDEKTEWLINGVLQEAAPEGAEGSSIAPITLSQWNKYVPVGKTGIFVDDIFYRVFGLRLTNPNVHRDVGDMGEYLPGFGLVRRNHRGQIAMLLDTREPIASYISHLRGNEPPFNFAQAIVIATPTNAMPAPKPDVPFSTVLAPGFKTDAKIPEASSP